MDHPGSRDFNVRLGELREELAALQSDHREEVAAYADGSEHLLEMKAKGIVLGETFLKNHAHHITMIGIQQAQIEALKEKIDEIGQAAMQISNLRRGVAALLEED